MILFQWCERMLAFICDVLLRIPVVGIISSFFRTSSL